MHVGAITCMGKRQTDPRPSLPLSPEGPHPTLIEILGYTRDQISRETKQISADRGVVRVGRKGLRDGRKGLHVSGGRMDQEREDSSTFDFQLSAEGHLGSDPPGVE